MKPVLVPFWPLMIGFALMVALLFSLIGKLTERPPYCIDWHIDYSERRPRVVCDAYGHELPTCPNPRLIGIARGRMIDLPTGLPCKR